MTFSQSDWFIFSLRDMLAVWTLIYHGTSTNQIARLPAIVVKKVGFVLILVYHYSNYFPGSLLLDSLISNLTTPEQQHCKALYLHVLSSNTAAIRFYESRCFRKFSYLPMYYAINGTHRDGYLYVLYVNGGTPPWTFSYPCNNNNNLLLLYDEHTIDHSPYDIVISLLSESFS
jgi:hypothetical protein